MWLMRLGIQSARAKWINEYAAPWKLITFFVDLKKGRLWGEKEGFRRIFRSFFSKEDLENQETLWPLLQFLPVFLLGLSHGLQFGQLFPLLMPLLLSLFQQFLHLPPMLDGLQTSLLCSQLLKPGILSELSQQLWKHQNQNHLLSLTLFMQEDDIGFWHFN